MKLEGLKQHGSLALKAILLIIVAVMLSQMVGDRLARAKCSKRAEDITKNRVRSETFVKHRNGEFYPQVHEILKGVYEDCLIQEGLL